MCFRMKTTLLVVGYSVVGMCGSTYSSMYFGYRDEQNLAITEQTKLTDMTWIQRILEFVQIESKSSSLFEMLE